jgi:SAM-dependent methyltransferase
MNHTASRRFDTDDLEARVKSMYELVALAPDQEFHFETGRGLAEHLGYPAADLDTVPAEGISSFAGVGYFLDLAALRPDETVLDLGSGSGTDSFLAARAVGPTGHVTGVDMTPAQLAKATRLAEEAGLANVAFVEGHIEDPPVPAGSVDCVISNGVINLCPDKRAVFEEIRRVLRPGGVLQFADIANGRPVPEEAMRQIDLWTG